MLKLKRSVTDSKDKTFSCYLGPLVSKTINIFANATSSSLYVSSTRVLRQKPFPSLNTPSRTLNVEGFSWQKGYRDPLAFVSYKKSYQKFLEALQLCLRIRQRGGNIHVIFDGDQFVPERDDKLQAPPQIIVQGKKKSSSGTWDNLIGFKPTLRESYSDRTRDCLKSTNFSAINFKTGQILVLPILGEGQQRTAFKEKLTFLDCKNLHLKTPTPVCFTNLYKIKKNFETNYSWSGDKWVGGTFSNFKQISKSINLYKTISRQFLEILETQISSRYLGMASKFHGNISEKESQKNKYDVFYDQKGRAVENWRTSIKLKAFQASASSAPLSSFSTFLNGDNKGQNRATEQDNYSSQKHLKLSVFNEILKQNKAKNLRNTNLPDLVIIENAEKYKNVIAEAEILKIPVIAFVESNTLLAISIPLPLNSLKHYFLAFLLQTISKTPNFS